MAIYYIVLLSVLSSIAQRGSKVLVSLYALQFGAGPLTVGALAAMYAIFPLLLAVHAGRVSDRIGVRRPMLLGASVMAIALAIPICASGLAVLFLCPALMGLGHIYFHVSIHNLVGSLGEDEARTRNFTTFALGASIAAFIGPAAAGFAIDFAGYVPAFLMLAGVAALPAVILLSRSGLVPPRAADHGAVPRQGRFDLAANPALRRTLVVSGVALTGIELFTFYFPIYGRAIGLSASAIGSILSCYAVAGFMVRTVMHRLARHYSETAVLAGSLFVAAATYLAMPLLGNAVVLALAAFALGLGLGSAQPLTIILTYNHAPKGRAGEALGMRLAVNKVTQIGVPIAFGGVGAAAGVAPVFIATGVFLFVGGLLAIRQLPPRSHSAPAPITGLAESPEEESR